MDLDEVFVKVLDVYQTRQRIYRISECICTRQETNYQHRVDWSFQSICNLMNICADTRPSTAYISKGITQALLSPMSSIRPRRSISPWYPTIYRGWAPNCMAIRRNWTGSIGRRPIECVYTQIRKPVHRSAYRWPVWEFEAGNVATGASEMRHGGFCMSQISRLNC